MEPRRTIVDLPWGHVSCLEWRPSAPTSTLVLLHGGGLDSASLSWGGIGTELARAGVHVIAPDHPGYGRSPAAPRRATQAHLVGYVGDLVDALGLERFAIAGLSLGGGMAIGHLLRRPHGVSSAMLLGTYGIMPRLPIAHGLAWAMLRTGAMRAIMRASSTDRRLLERSLAAIVRTQERRTPALLDEVMRTAAQGRSLEAFDQWQREQVLPGRLRTDYSDRLHAIDVPTLVVHGDRDTGVPIAHARRAAAALPHGCMLEVPGAGHWVHRDRPDVVVPAMLAHLER